MPGNPFVLAITVYDTDGSTAKENVKVTVRNESTNEVLTGNSDVDGHVIFNLANLDSGWTSGDIISYFVLYTGYESSGSFTVTDTGGTDKSLTLVASPIAPSLRYFTVQEWYDFFDLPQYTTDPENGIKPQTIVKIGQMVESEIDNITNRTWDTNGGSYYTATQEYHNAGVSSNGWPESVDVASVNTDNLFFTNHGPIYAITTFEVNSNPPNVAASWQTLTEAAYQIRVRGELHRVQIVDTSKYPAAGKDQVRITYTYGITTPYDIKLLAIMMTGQYLAKGQLQRLNITTSEAEGLSSAVQNLINMQPKIDAIISSRRFVRVRRI